MSLMARLKTVIMWELGDELETVSGYWKPEMPDGTRAKVVAVGINRKIELCDLVYIKWLDGPLVGQQHTIIDWDTSFRLVFKK